MSTLVNMDKKYFVLHVTNMGIKKNFAIFTQLRKMSKKKMPYSYLISVFQSPQFHPHEINDCSLIRFGHRNDGCDQ
jgi:hypothetical protein